jgi:hypothetical protein
MGCGRRPAERHRHARGLLCEPFPDDPVEDELWVNLVIGLAQE